MELTDGICEHVADQNGSTELDNIVTPEHTTYEDIDDVLRSFIDLAAQHKRTSSHWWHGTDATKHLSTSKSGTAQGPGG